MTFQNVVLRDVYYHLALFKILNHLHFKMLEWVPQMWAKWWERRSSSQPW